MATDGRIFVVVGTLLVKSALMETERFILDRLEDKYQNVAEYEDEGKTTMFFPIAEPQDIFGEYARLPLNLPTNIQVAPFRTNDINPLLDVFADRSYLDSIVLLDKMEGQEQLVLQRSFERSCRQSRDPLDEHLYEGEYGVNGLFTQEDIDNLAIVFRSEYGLITGKWLYTYIF